MIFNYDVSDLLNRLAELQQALEGELGEDISEVQGDIGKTKSSIAVVEDEDTATHSITSGTYVIWKGDMYTASSDIDVGDTLSASNLTAVTGGGLNEIAALLATEISDRIAAFNGFSIDLSAGKSTVAEVVSAISAKATGDVLLIRLAGTLASTFLGVTTSNPAVALIMKASTNNAYFFTFNRDGASSGNLSLANSTITPLHTYISATDVSPLFSNSLSVSIDNITINATTNLTIDTSTSAYSAYKPSKAGYRPIAIAGFKFTNASTNGANADKCTTYGLHMDANGNVILNIRNRGSETAVIKVRVDILWVKNS